MIELSLEQVAQYVGGTVVIPGTASDVGTGTGAPTGVSDDIRITGDVVIDSRACRPGDLFVAIKGDVHDGNLYADDAIAAGAVAAIVSSPVNGPHVLVPDTTIALARLATGVLSARPAVRVVAVTGSSGKTSTKDILGQLLAQVGPTVWPEGSFNNEIGLPLTVLRMTDETEFLVLEMGARGVGHIRTLCEIAQPDVSVVLNVGSAHVGEFGSQSVIAEAKSELVTGLREGGVAVLNRDDPNVAAMAAKAPGDVVFFGGGAEADVQAIDIELDASARPTLSLAIGDAVQTVSLQLHGEHQAANAAAAAAAASALGVPADKIFRALATVTVQSRWRMEVTELPDGTTVVNDAYNANPESMTAALKALAAMGRGRTTWAVLGEMRELGNESISAHDEVGRRAVRLGIDRLIGIGPACRPMVVGAAAEGYYGGEAHYSPDADDAAQYLRENLSAGDVVLFKASRAAGLERLAGHVIDELTASQSIEDSVSAGGAGSTTSELVEGSTT